MNQKELHIKRYPLTTDDRSLKAWNAADELIIDYLQSLLNNKNTFGIYHDRFGYLSAHLQAHQPYTIITYKSQEAAILENFNQNKLENSVLRFIKSNERIG